jgi:secondary thiamine-phosphate synthase enzyme
MPCHQHTFSVRTTSHNQVVDISAEVHDAVRATGARSGQCTVFTPHATAAITINENDDPNIGDDLVSALKKMVIEHDGWLHDRVDNNAAAHIKAAIIGPSETIPIVDVRLPLGRWQNIFLCDFDGPRSSRRVVVSIMT